MQHPVTLAEANMLEALASMRDQYCGEMGHCYMSAGENCSAILEEYGYLPSSSDGADLSAKGGYTIIVPNGRLRTEYIIKKGAYRMIPPFDNQ